MNELTSVSVITTIELLEILERRVHDIINRITWRVNNCELTKEDMTLIKDITDILYQERTKIE